MPNVKESTITLFTLLNACTKDELHNIRRTLNVPNASQLNKKDLVQRLIPPIIDHVEEILGWFDHKRYSVLKKVIEVPNAILPVIVFSDNEDYEPVYYQHHGLMFLLENAVIMPHEIREKLLQVDAKRLKAILDRNTEWIQLTQGLLFYYGNMKLIELKNKVEYYTKQPIDFWAYMRVIYDFSRYDLGIEFSKFGVSHYMVIDPQRIELEQLNRPDLHYYPFTKAQILRAADDDYVDRHEGYRQFELFLRQNWEIDEVGADLMTGALVECIKQGDSPPKLVASLQNELDFSDMNQVQELLNLLMVLMNKTRLWELKGHSPEEVLTKEQKVLKPLPKHPIQAGKSVLKPNSQKINDSGIVYNFETKMKVGRNDPCPCGSGRKFKKCCGS
ncbi:MAG TPA: SEC-C metal-binding domain-containing protein [Bacillota bacterium]|nr:SEC-C metal-binding domain-containing protein [Bacillota bacterium]